MPTYTHRSCSYKMSVRLPLCFILFTLVLLLQFTAASASSHSTQHVHDTTGEHEHEIPYRIHDAHERQDARAPDYVSFRGAIYTRNDLVGGADLLSVGSNEWYLHVLGTVVCVSLAALAAGLTVGLVSIDPFDLAVIQSTEEADCANEQEIEELRQEKGYADRLLPIVQKHHLLLVTLLIMNACANEVLPLLLDNLVPSWMAVLLSVTFVLLFGEILPSSIFTGKAQLRLAAALSPVVVCFMAILFPIAWPIAWILDQTLGVEDESRLRRSELKSLIRLQANRSVSGHGPHGSSSGSDSKLLSPADSPTHEDRVFTEEEAHERGVLSLDEMTILHGVLEMKDRTVSDAMVPLEEIFMLDLDTILDIDSLANIVHQGHSRIPIYEGRRENIRGVLLVKRLIVLNPEDKRPLRTIATRWPLICSPEMHCLDVLNLFQTGRSHMAIIATDPQAMMDALRNEQPVPDTCHVLGIITIEDVLELIIKEEISDETDAGVRDMLEHSAVVRRRIEKLKLLAAKMSGTSGGPFRRHTRGASLAVSRTSSSTTTTLSNPRVMLSPGSSMVSPTPSNVSETAGLLSLSRAPTLTNYQSVEEVKVDVLTVSATLQPAEDSLRPALSSALPRDSSFTKHPIRTQSTVTSRSPAAPHALPPTGADGLHSGHPPLHPPTQRSDSSVDSVVSGLATNPRRASSGLTPRVVRSSDAMTRKDAAVDKSTIAALKSLQEARTVAASSATSDGSNTSERTRLLSEERKE